MTESRWRNAHRRIVTADLAADDAVLPLAVLAGTGGTRVRDLESGTRRQRLGNQAWTFASFTVCTVGLVAMARPVVVWVASLHHPGWIEVVGLTLDLLVIAAMAYWALIILGYWRFRARQRHLRRTIRGRR